MKVILPMRHSSSRARTRIAAAVAIGAGAWMTSTAHAAVDGGGGGAAAPAQPGLLTAIVNAAIVYGIAIVISFATALMITLMNVVLARRGARETEQA